MKTTNFVRFIIITLVLLISVTSCVFAEHMDNLNPDKFELVNPATKNVIREKKVSSGKVVKVGWFFGDGIHQLDPDGTLSGYDYEWLQAIAQYNNWTYEYHFGSFAECYRWLRDGEIDLMGMINKTPERESLFDFSRVNVGIEQCCIYTNNDNSRFEYEDFYHFDDMVIGIEDGTVQGEMLRLYAEANHFNYTTKVYPNLDDARVALLDRKIDALLASNTDVIRGFKTIARFNPIPFYFATTKGNHEVLAGVNSAMDKIMIYNPNFNNFLYSKYFDQSSSEKIVFSSKELEYIKKNPKILVLIDPIWYPLESYSGVSHKFDGIIPNILDEISKRSGLNFTFVKSQSSVDALETISSDSAVNTITSISFDYKWANENNVTITQPILTTSIQMVRNNHKKFATVALVRRDYISNMVKLKYPNLKPIYYENMLSCINAVKNGKADVTFMNNLESEYYISLQKYNELQFSNINAFNQNICLGISKEANPLLLSIISKCIQDIPASTIQDIMLRNVYVSNNVSLSEFIRTHTTGVVIFIVITFLVLLAWMYLIFRTRMRASSLIALENKKFNQLSEISNEHIFEYDYNTDVLKFKNSSTPMILKNPFPDYSKYILNSDSDYENTLYSCLADKVDSIRDINYEYANGIKNWLRVTTKIVNDDANRPAYAIGKLQNVQSEHEELELLIEQATTDNLTHVLNSTSFKNNAKSNMRQYSCLILMDLDHFKSINDRYGHLSGDFVLVEFAKVLTTVFGNIGFPGRVGGDEFAVFIPNKLTEDEIATLCKRTLESVEKIQFKFKGVTVSPVKTSIGASILQDGQTFDDLYEIADQMLYTVKENGRNGYKIDYK